MSTEHAAFLKRLRFTKLCIRLVQVGLLVGFFALWEVATQLGWLDSFLVSSPSRVWSTILLLHADGSLYRHIAITSLVTMVGFVGGTVIGTFIAALLWWFPTLYLTAQPFLIVINSLPKIALGPLFIVWLGTGYLTIIAIALAISLVTTVIVVHSGFANIDPLKLKLVHSFGATKWQSFRLVILPGSFPTIMSALKVNVGLSWVGVIAGEFLVSRAGLGYLAVYGGQVLNMSLVMTSVLILCVAAALMYQAIVLLELRQRGRFLN
ncbi:MAG: ABC transporter permease [Firmicutes bacterium]|nr:ABC transporter permease [Dethiobacter sp.]MBS3888956.1 ABC transporter permease [Bacillota bacterium]MBS4054278.1 ABC transporter permease [Thermaerobacter sp.]